MIRYKVVRVTMNIHGECFVTVSGKDLPEKFFNISGALARAKDLAASMAEEKGGTYRLTNQLENYKFDSAFFLVEWDDEKPIAESKTTHRRIFSERQFMPTLGAILCFIAAFQIGQVAESARDWFMFYVLVISFAMQLLHAWEARK